MYSASRNKANELLCLYKLALHAFYYNLSSHLRIYNDTLLFYFHLVEYHRWCDHRTLSSLVYIESGRRKWIKKEEFSSSSRFKSIRSTIRNDIKNK